jgi:hypothetical protein
MAIAMFRPILEPIEPQKMIVNGSASNVTGFGLNDWCFIPSRGSYFLLCQHVQICSGAPKHLVPWCTGCCFPRVKQLECDDWSLMPM